MREDGEETASSKAFDEMQRPLLTNEPNIRVWLRQRRKAAYHQARADDQLDNYGLRTAVPWGETKPAAVEDVIPGAVLWWAVPGGEGKRLGGDAHEWYYVERLDDSPGAAPGTFIDHRGETRHVDGLLAEVYTEKAVRDAEGMERMLGGDRTSAIASVYGTLMFGISKGNAGVVSVSAEFYERLNEEAAKLELQTVNGEVVSMYGVTVRVDDDLEEGAMRFTSGKNSGQFNLDGLKPEDLNGD